MGVGEAGTPRPWRHGDRLGWPTGSPAVSLPHGVGAANSGLHSTNYRSSDEGEVRSLEQDTKGVTFSAEATCNAPVPSFLTLKLASSCPSLGVCPHMHTHTHTATAPISIFPRIKVKNRSRTECKEQLQQTQARSSDNTPQTKLHTQSLVRRDSERQTHD